MKTLEDNVIYDNDGDLEIAGHDWQWVDPGTLRKEAINSIKEIEQADSPTEGFVEVDGFMLHKETARTLLKYLNNLEEKDLR